jgi:hypothetical protein
MGSHLHLYLGPYVEGVLVPTSRSEQVRGCPNDKCSKPKPKKPYQAVAAEFCDKCGTAIAELAITITTTPSIYNVTDDDRLTSVGADDGPDGHVFLGCNLAKGPTRDFYPEDEFHIDVTAIDVAAEIAWFKVEYAKEIAELTAALQDVKIGWGLHQYYM